MALLPINPSPCIPGVGEGGRLGTAWEGGGSIGFGLDGRGGQSGNGVDGLNGRSGSGLDGAGGAAGADAKAQKALEGVNGLAQALRELSQKLSTNFVRLNTIVTELEESNRGGFAILKETLYQGGTAVAERLDWGNPGFFHSGVDFEVVDFYLNAGESIELGTKIEVKSYQGVLVVANAYCTPSDTV